MLPLPPPMALKLDSEFCIALIWTLSPSILSSLMHNRSFASHASGGNCKLNFQLKLGSLLLVQGGLLLYLSSRPLVKLVLIWINSFLMLSIKDCYQKQIAKVKNFWKSKYPDSSNCFWAKIFHPNLVSSTVLFYCFFNLAHWSSAWIQTTLVTK